ncbi:family 78 glycoside hydrolase catalytic domain [Microbacterium chocolatum]|uniref:alpha-L-rhamnosidase n=1 Tax=Microbacterium aurantiacum TaxID=162393 RepID=UPI00338E275F
MTHVFAIGVGHTNVLAVGTRPRLSWKIASENHPWMQTAATVRWHRADGETREVTMSTERSVDIKWPFAELPAVGMHSLTVSTRDQHGAWSDSLQPYVFRVSEGFQEPLAPMLAHPDPRDVAQPVYLRGEVVLPAEVVNARLLLAARGSVEVFVNSASALDQTLTGGWPSFGDRLIGDEVDITDVARPGSNTIGVVLAGTWYTEEYGHLGDTTRFYGSQPALSLRIIATLSSGRTLVVDADETWVVSDGGPLRSASLYQGEEVDLRLAVSDWSAPGSAPFWGWVPVRVLDAPRRVDLRDFPAVRPCGELAVTSHDTRDDGRVIVDFGQNHAGRLRIDVHGEAGDRITIRHAEVLEGGELALRPLRFAKATDSFILSGGREVLEARFTFHGYRYAEITGLRGEFVAESVRSIILGSDLARTGTFRSSDEMLNRLHENIVWSTRSNFLAIPTDCPQRDERLGWTGDIQVFARTSSFLFDDNAFLQSWLVDLALEQTSRGGRVPVIVPDPINDIPTPAAAWGDAATLVPWALYERYADSSVLHRQLPSMKAWVELVDARATNGLWTGDFQFGDWLDPTAPPDDPGRAMTSADLVATAYLHHSARITARACEVVGDKDALLFQDIATRARDAFRSAFAVGDGRLRSDTVTSYAIAIEFDLAEDDEERALFGARLAELVEGAGHRIATGFVGTPLVCDALSNTGNAATAERLLFERECPSWLYPVTMGATTIWERWDSLLPDGSVNPGEMTSFNHYALGAVADWLHRRVAGLAPGAPGYAVTRIAPLFLEGLTHAEAVLESVHGEIRAGWYRAADGDICVEASIPANARAEVVLPGVPVTRVGSGAHAWRVAACERSSPAA